MLLSIIFIGLAWLTGRVPIKSNPALSLTWRGALGGFFGGFFALLGLLGNDLTLFFPLTFLTPFTMTIGVMFAWIVRIIQRKTRISAGWFVRVLLGAIAGITIGVIFGALAPHIQYEGYAGVYRAERNVTAESIRVCLTFGVLIGIMAGLMVGPRAESNLSNKDV